MALTKSYVNISIGNIQSLYARFADEYCNMLKRRIGSQTVLNKMTSINKAVGFILNRLSDYEAYGVALINDENNNLSDIEAEELIQWCYRNLNKYMNKVFLPSNPNIYL